MMSTKGKNFTTYGHNQTQNLGIFLTIVWGLYTVTSPIYIFSKGLPQPADLIMITGIMAGIMTSFLNFKGKIPLIYMVGSIFVGLTFVINLVNYAFFPDIKFLLGALFYLYNFLVFSFIVFLFNKDFVFVKNITYIGVIIAIAIQCGWATIFPDVGMRRMTGGFHNPNQLAYWALICGATIFFIKRGEKFNKFDFVAFAMIGYIQSLSLSKAGIISYIVFLTILVFARQTDKMVKAGIILMIYILGTFLVFQADKVQYISSHFDASARVMKRLATLGKEGDDSLEGRGYDRLWKYPEYLLWGSGEGAFYRFSTWKDSRNLELHSGLATILFSYGILGFTFFGFFVFLIFQKQKPQYWLIIFTVLLFSISSQTIRFTHTWVLFGIAYASYLHTRKMQQEDLMQNHQKQEQIQKT